jgi:hypothetical protein
MLKIMQLIYVTLDGTNGTSVKDVISEHDLIIAQASNPGVLIKEIKTFPECNWN